MEEYPVERVLEAMICHDAGDPGLIHHFLKVHSFARLIALAEGLGPRDLLVTQTAAAVHDIGILRSRAVYGDSLGKHQEELGPAEAKALLEGLGWPRDAIDRVCCLVGRHHTYTDIDGPDCQILVEADFLVNLYEERSSPEAQRHAYETIFRTEAGRRLCRSLFPAVSDNGYSQWT